MDEKKYRNKIITISGEPVSGKGTTVKMLVEDLKKKGYKEDQIHLKSTGNEFRFYFNSIIDLIKNHDDNEKIKEIMDRDGMKSLIDSPEKRQLFIENIARLTAKYKDLSKFKIEDANINTDFNELRAMIDAQIDNNMVEMGKKINSENHPNDIWIIDSRLAFHNIPDSFSVRLTSRDKIAGERLFNDKTRGNEDKYQTIEEAITERKRRRESETARYIKKYGINLEDENNYDLIIDTSYSNTRDISNCILECLDYYQQNKEFAKNWASPKIFIPTQSEMETVTSTPGGTDLSELKKLIDKNGYYPDSPIEVLDVDNIKYIYEGHHRNFAAANLGKTLVPYIVIAKNDEKIYTSQTTARQYAFLERKYLLGHQGFIEDGLNESFSYFDIYPEIAKEIKKENRDI